jgi:hypothetical protein
MRCPYCAIEMHPVPDSRGLGHGAWGNRMFYNDREGTNHSVESVVCPKCAGVILTHSDMLIKDSFEPGTVTTEDVNMVILLPRVSSRPPLPPEVPEPYASLYEEAGLILQDSPRASAGLSRRALQHLLREELHAPKADLYHEIEWVLANVGLPVYVTDSLHELRTIGNMAMHPNKSTATGDYLEVEPGEAEWTLDTLDALFSHLFIEPAKTAARKAALAART